MNSRRLAVGDREVPARAPVTQDRMTHPTNGEIERYTDHYFNRTKQVIGKFGDCRVTYAIFMRRPVVFAPRLALEWLEETRPRAQHRGRSRPALQRGQVGRRRRADDVHHRLVLPSGRPRDDLPAEARSGLRRRLQRLDDVRRHAEVGLPRHGCAPLRRPGDGRDDGLCRLGRLGARQAQGRRRGLHRQRHPCDRAFLRPRARARHHAARADRLCRLDRCAPPRCSTRPFPASR